MKTRLAVALVTLLLLSTVGAAVGPGSTATDASADASSPTVATLATNETNETSMGAQVSSFMQSSSAAANGSVDSGMFGAAFNATDNESRASAVERRTAVLSARLDRLQEEKQALLAREDELSDVAFAAQMSSLVARINALERAIDQTATFAERSGADLARVEQLRDEANNLSGHEVAAIAHKLHGVDAPGQRGEAPQSQRGTGTNQSGASNQTGTGPASGAQNGSSNGQSGTAGQSGGQNGGAESGERGRSDESLAPPRRLAVR